MIITYFEIGFDRNEGVHRLNRLIVKPGCKRLLISLLDHCSWQVGQLVC